MPARRLLAHARRPRELAAIGLDRLALALTRPDDLLVEGPSAEPAVALTFDDGPSPHNTPELLGLFGEHGARATFFVVGEEVAGREAILERAVADGHELANHTYSHPHTVYLRRSQILEEVVRTNEAIASVGGQGRLVRPPFGKDRRRTLQVARGLGMRVALWSVDSGDTRGLSAAGIAEGVLGAVRPGAIVLLHDGGDRRRETLGACAGILDGLDRAGLRAVTVSELLQASATPR